MTAEVNTEPKKPRAFCKCEKPVPAKFSSDEVFTTRPLLGAVRRVAANTTGEWCDNRDGKKGCGLEIPGKRLTSVSDMK